MRDESPNTRRSQHARLPPLEKCIADARKAPARSAAAAEDDSGSKSDGPFRWERVGSGSSSDGGSSSGEEDEDSGGKGASRRRPAPLAALQERKMQSRRRRARALQPFAPGEDGWYELLPVRIRNAIIAYVTVDAWLETGRGG